jgi:glycine/D-amino acid oxidase-like deaminating enzyme
MAVSPHVIVVGAGILGASLAYHLAREGARVTVVATSFGGIATPNSFSWINASWGNAPAYFQLRFESMQQWRRLEREIPGLGLSWGGGLTFDLSEPNLLHYVADYGAMGYPLRLVEEAEIHKIAPNLARPPQLAAYAEAEGAVEQGVATQALLKASSAVLVQTTVHGLDTRGGRVVSVMTAERSMTADHVVLAAGTGTPQLLATLGLAFEIDAPPGLIVHTRPLPRLLRQVIVGPALHMRQTLDGKLIAGSDFGGSPIERGPAVVADELMTELRSAIAGAEDAVMARYSIGYRPTPKDGLPIAGPIPGFEGLYVAVMHSGITNAPAIGALGAREIISGEPNELLLPCAITRFLQE